MDLEELAQATKGFSGADLAELCQRAIKLATSEAVDFLNADIVDIADWQDRSKIIACAYKTGSLRGSVEYSALFGQSRGCEEV